MVKTIMKMNRMIVGLATVWIAGVIAAPEGFAQNFQKTALQKIESRFRGIYERGEFRAKVFRANWLPDSSGYVVMEPVPGARKRVRVRYDAASGEHSVLESRGRDRTRRGGRPSPDGRRVLYSDRGNLRIRDLESGSSGGSRSERSGDNTGYRSRATRPRTPPHQPRTAMTSLIGLALHRSSEGYPLGENIQE